MIRARAILWSTIAVGVIVSLATRSPHPTSEPVVTVVPVPAPPVVHVVPPVIHAPPPPPPTRVVIISVDGLRPDMITPDVMPRHVRLMSQGVTARLASTIPQSDTLPSHAAMLSGRGSAAHGLTWNSYKENRGFIRVPTIFSSAREHGLSTAMIVGKQKLRHIAGPQSVGYFERPSYLCGGVARRAAQYFTTKTPDLLFVHFSDPDEYGHSHGWLSKEYVRAAKNSDACLGIVLDAIDASPAGASTLVIVTADHGGADHVHSDGRMAVNGHIPWIARGRGIAPGSVIEEPVATFDTAATTLAVLGLPSLPKMSGSSRVQFVR
jgi:predicted AlkP superfamily pyrophosphatase or phosphodiesterase